MYLQYEISAFALLPSKDNSPNSLTAPAWCWAQNVANPSATASPKNGTFSTSKAPRPFQGKASASELETRLSGQRSRSKKTTGKVTSIGLLKSPSAKRASAAQYQLHVFKALASTLCVYRA